MANHSFISTNTTLITGTVVEFCFQPWVDKVCDGSSVEDRIDPINYVNVVVWAAQRSYKHRLPPLWLLDLHTTI